MSSVEVESHGVDAVARFGVLLDEFMTRAESTKPNPSIEPPLEKGFFSDLLSRLSNLFASSETKPTTTVSGAKQADAADSNRSQQFAVIEAAVRDVFTNTVALTEVDSPAFVRIWHLFDIVSMLSECEMCDSTLVFWLIEELLDGQTIAACRKVFEFLENRRERMTKNLSNSAKLVVLRACNELLRRLSKAEDAAFCGRIFIYMFQCFPLGDKSSVNLRGEYHVENVTSYDTSSEGMNIDAPGGGTHTAANETNGRKAASIAGRMSQYSDKSLDLNRLYPIFWSLQESFSQPKKLFEETNLSRFKKGLEATLRTFQATRTDLRSKSDSLQKQDRQDDLSKRGVKRKYEGDGMAAGLNLKYLTSRDLFNLELGDRDFRRNILIQALVILDFLLSLTPKAREKLSSIAVPNKSVTYTEFSLSDEDAKWATEMKGTILEYLHPAQQSLPQETRQFHIVVTSILAREKNWVRWKTVNCPPIALPEVDVDTFAEAKAAAKKLATNKRLRPSPLGSLPLSFLDEDTTDGLQKFKSKERHGIAELNSFKRKIADEDFEIEMPTSNETKAAAIENKASMSWRALRLASKFKLCALDKIDSPDKIDPIFEDELPAAEEDQQPQEQELRFPDDRKPLVIVDPFLGDDSLVGALLFKSHPAVFSKVIGHTTRSRRSAEKDGVDNYFIDISTFRVMRDGDQFVAFSQRESSVNYGFSKKALDAVVEKGKVPVLLMSCEEIEMLKNNGISARTAFVRPPAGELEAKLRREKLSDTDIKKRLKIIEAEVQHARYHPGIYDLFLPGDKTEEAYKLLEHFIYDSGDEALPDAPAADVSEGPTPVGAEIAEKN